MVPFYVGKGKGRRKLEHLSQGKKHKNKYMAVVLGDLKDAGKKPIINEVFKNEDPNIVINEEIKLIKSYGRLNNETGSLCNIVDDSRGGESGHIKTEEEINTWRNSYNKTPKGKSIDQYTLDGKFIQTFPDSKSLKDAGFRSRNRIYRACKGYMQMNKGSARSIYFSAYGYRWAFTGEQLVEYDTKINKPIFQIDKNTLRVINAFATVKIASEMCNIGIETLYYCLRGDTWTAGGFIWKYQNSNEEILPKPKQGHQFMKPVVQMDSVGNILHTFDSITDASKTLGINVSNIWSVCNGERSKAGKYKWKYKDSPSVDFIFRNGNKKSVIH